MKLSHSLLMKIWSIANTAIPDIDRKHFLSHGHTIGAIMLWVVLIYASASDSNHQTTIAIKELNSDTAQLTKSKSEELSTVFRELYIVTRTISLLPAIRKVVPQNRHTADDNVIDGRRFDKEAAETVRQIYNHAASIASVSEIYVVYEGFRPDLGQVPFIMFDDVIADRIQGAHVKNNVLGINNNLSDIPEEDESEEYAYLQKLLDRFQKEYPKIPPRSPKGIGMDISPVMITCDNSQYLSIRDGNPENRLGVIISVPIFDNINGQFKGLISTIVRTNVLEARLLGWPYIPTTVSEQQQAILDGINLNNSTSYYVLENKTKGIYIYDRRNTQIPQYINGSLPHMSEFIEPVNINDDYQWFLHQYIPQEKIQAINNESQQFLINRIINITILFIVLLGGLWLYLQRRITTEMETLASLDSLTGLPNRRILTRKITNTLITAQKDHQQTALVMVDLDDFKMVNDSIGHAAGDAVLQEVGRRLKLILRSTDVVEQFFLSEFQDKFEPVVGRLGGDEFLIILPNVGLQSQALSVAERIMAGLAMPVQVDGHSTYIHASMGIAIFPIHGDNADILLRHADNAMYAAKSIKGNSVVVYNEHLDFSSTRHLELMCDMHAALEKEQFTLHYQPIFDIANQRMSTVEVLLRWQHPKYGMIMPDELIPLLEQSGLVVEAGYWVLRKTCQQLVHWKQEGSPIERASINVSTIQVTQSDFATKTIEILNEEGLTPESVMVEITGSVMTDDPTIQLQQLRILCDLGMQVVLDNFGTGYSSLTHLLKLPVGAFKINCSMVSQIDNKSSRAIVFTLCDLARRMDIACIAKGVETIAECRLLIEAGCHYIQGQIICKALPAEQVDRQIQFFDYNAICAGGKQLSTLATSS